MLRKSGDAAGSMLEASNAKFKWIGSVQLVKSCAGER